MGEVEVKKTEVKVRELREVRPAPVNSVDRR